jgi:hypothetical protein
MVDQADEQAAGRVGIEKAREADFENQGIRCCLWSDCQQGLASFCHDFIFGIPVKVHRPNDQCESHGSASGYSGPAVDEQWFGELACGDKASGSGLGQIIAVCAADLLDEPVLSHAPQPPANLVGLPARQVFTQTAVGQPADLVFAPHHRCHELKVFLAEEVHSAVAAAFLIFHARGDAPQVMSLPGAVGPLADEAEEAAVDRSHGLAQGSEAHERPAHRCVFADRRRGRGRGRGRGLGFAEGEGRAQCLAALLSRGHLAVAGERLDVAGGAFDARDESGLIIHFDACRAQGVFDAGALDEGLEAAGGFGLGAGGGLAFAGEAVDVGALDLDGGGAHELLVEAGQDALVFKHDVKGDLGLIDAPLEVVAEAVVEGDPAGGAAVYGAEDGCGIEGVSTLASATNCSASNGVTAGLKLHSIARPTYHVGPQP